MSAQSPSLDIFCRVIDNFGDAGVCGRLARQWSLEIGAKVRLFIDAPDVLQIILPPPHSFDVILWDESIEYPYAADMVIEAFACSLPESVILSMKNRPIPSVWVDLEYLSAENWVERFHAIPSLHPLTGLAKTVFFPGFTHRTGGLIQENGIFSRRNAFIADINEQDRWRRDHFLPEIDKNAIDISFFCYKTAPRVEFLEKMATYHRPVRVFCPEKRADVYVSTSGNLTVIRMPFVPQEDYDLLCWTSDLNFVRGEDSFVRAQFSGKPLIWNIYAQDENTHLVKLQAFLAHYLPFFGENGRDLLAQAHILWNEGCRNRGDIWHHLLDSLPILTEGSGRWADNCASHASLTANLLKFFKEQTK